LTRYTIVLTRFQQTPEDQQGLTQGERLAQAFGISLERAETYVQTVPCVIKRSASLEEALRYQGLLGRIGAIAELRPHDTAGRTESAAVEPTAGPSLIAPPLVASASSPAAARAPAPAAPAPTPTAPAPTPTEMDTVSFLGGVHRALLAPLRGGGIVWLLCLSGVLFVVASATAIPCLGLFIAFPVMALYCGLYREMFGCGVSHGCGDEPRALSLSDLLALRGRALEMALQGLLIMLVSGLLQGATAYAWSALQLSDTSVQVCANPNNAQDARPENETLEETARSETADEDDSRGSASKKAGDSTNTPRRQGCVNAPALTARGFGLAWLMLLIQGIYWPMALTLSHLTGRITDLFNVGRIVRGIYAGGWDYVVVVLLGTTGFASIIVIPTLIVAWGTPFGAILLLLLTLPWIAYVGSAVSYLMGRMLAARAEELGFLDE